MQICSVRAQSLEPLYFNYTKEDGLPSSECYEIIQDKKGYIWISTDNGVCRYDGHDFEHFGIEQGLTDRTILFMHEDHRGWIWMNSMDGNFFIHRGDSIATFPFNNCIQDLRHQFDFVHDFFVDKTGKLHLSLRGYGILTIDPIGNCDIDWQFEKSSFGQYGIYDHQDGFLQLSQVGRTGLLGKNYLLHLTNRRNGDEIVEKNLTVLDYNRLSAKELFYAFPLDKTYLIQVKGQMEIRDQQLTTKANWEFERGTINCLKVLSDDRVILGFFEKSGLYVYENTTALQNNMAPQLLFDGHTISHICEDHQGGIWIATIERGIYYMPSLDRQQLPLNLLTDEIAALASSGDRDSTLYIGTKGGRLLQLDSTFELIEHPNLTGNFELSKLHYLTDKQLLIAANPLSVFNGTHWREFIEYPDSTIFLKHRILNGFVSVPAGSSIMGFTSTGALFQILPEEAPPLIQTFFKGRSKLFITTALQESKSSYWLGTKFGLFKSQDINDNGSHLTDTLLANVAINALQYLPDRSFVVGTEDQGLFQIHSTPDNSKEIDNILPNQSIESLHLAPDSSLWVVSRNGIYKYKYHDTLLLQGVLSTKNGLPSNQVLDLAFTPGQVWVAGKQDLTVHPINFDIVVDNLAVQVIATSVDGTPAAAGHTLQMGHNSRCRIQFSAFDYASNGTTRYRYRLDAKGQWIETNESEINFSNLNADEYALELQVLNSNNTWSSSTELLIIVNPPFWQTSWFIFLCLGLAFLLLYTLFQRRLNSLSREKERLALKDEVERLQQQAYRAQMNPHFIFNCLSTIQGMVMGDAADKDAAVRLLANFSQLIRYALDASRQEFVSLKDELDLLHRYMLLEKERFSHRFDFSIHLAPEIEPDWIQIPPMLIQPYVENAVLHGMADKTSEGQIKLQYQLEGEHLVVTIEDNGPGIYQQQAQQMKKRGKYRHKSVGMMITKKRLEMLSEGQSPPKIEEITSLDGSITGTRITLSIPL